MSRTAIALKIIPVAGAGAVLLAALAACSNGAPSPAPSSPAAAGSSAAGGQAITTTTTTDPCQLVTPPEASALTGASYGPGTERAIGPGKTCVYGSATKNVFMGDVFQAASSGDLRQLRDQLVAEITQGGHMTPTPVSGLGDQATAYQVTTDIFNGASIFVLTGTSAVYLVDEVTGGQVPTTAAPTASARTALGRLP